MKNTSILFEPFGLKRVHLRNRFIMSSMTRCFSPGGVPGENVAQYYARRAAADVGLIMTEGAGVDHPSAIGKSIMGEDNMPHLYGEAALAGWRNVVSAVHAAGGVIFPQLWHMGAFRLDSDPGLTPSFRPSGLWGPADGRQSLPSEYVAAMQTPTEPMTEKEIQDVIAAFARSARNAVDVGFDGVAIHGGHGYLIDSFLWEKTNLRTDDWGGDLGRRTRFAVEVVKAIRREVGAEIPISFRWSQWKQQDYDAELAHTPAELEQLLGPIADAGVDLFDTSTRRFDQAGFPGSDLTLAGWVKKITGKPCSAVGSAGLSKDLQSSFAGDTVALNNLDLVAERVEAGEFDLIAAARSLLVDPDWVRKIRADGPLEPFSFEKFGELN